MALDIRTLSTNEEFDAWMRGAATGFLRADKITDEEIRTRLGAVELDRIQGAFDGGRCVGTFRTIPQELTVPGGATVSSCGVSGVTVSPTHRRRGLLGRMMANAMEAAKERGDVLASLVAAEYRIYGRYGYGPAAWSAEWTVEIPRSGFDPRYAGPSDGGRVDLADPDEVLRVMPEVYERYRVQQHRQGIIDRDEMWWKRTVGAARFPGDGFTPRFYAVYRDAQGVPQGLAVYVVDDHWTGQQPDVTATVHTLFGTSPEAERALWHYVLSIDWVSRVATGSRSPDDVLPHLLPDPRGARITSYADFLWVRPLDVPRMLEARTYDTHGALVLEVRDAAGFADGRFRLETAPGEGGAKCAPTRDDADLALDVAELGRLFLGDESVSRLLATGRAEERRAGAAATGDAVFRTARRPWCPDTF
ncbi:GNAT family N-acetyltransferase [Streptomyces sp. ODS28]|uniref:GNAT family N-acetyltransferase n=1 Tax=Streptomyces sp. ODS28 TaxID=3136688 RepID=UPI0031E5DD94